MLRLRSGLPFVLVLIPLREERRCAAERTQSSLTWLGNHIQAQAGTYEESMLVVS